MLHGQGLFSKIIICQETYWQNWIARLKAQHPLQWRQDSGLSHRTGDPAVRPGTKPGTRPAARGQTTPRWQLSSCHKLSHFNIITLLENQWKQFRSEVGVNLKAGGRRGGGGDTDMKKRHKKYRQLLAWFHKEGGLHHHACLPLPIPCIKFCASWPLSD